MNRQKVAAPEVATEVAPKFAPEAPHVKKGKEFRKKDGLVLRLFLSWVHARSPIDVYQMSAKTESKA